ncbi:MAG: hypothetical protein ABI426_09190 [Flavobacterium sp.]
MSIEKIKAIRKYFILSIIIVCVSCANDTNKERILSVGNELLNTDLSKTNSTENTVYIGVNLKKKIIELKKQNLSINFEISNGDLNNPFGNFEAENVLILNNGVQKVDIRLRYNSKKKKFDILGFMTE